MIWEIDSIRSRVLFAIRVMSVTTTRGSFDTLQGQLHIDEQNPANSWVEAEVDAASINTHNILRDTHLRSNAFFAVKKYPTTAFKSTRVEHIGGSAYKVTGNLLSTEALPRNQQLIPKMYKSPREFAVHNRRV